MSAESSCVTINVGGHVISPQPVSDRSIIESVAGFINDVVPQGYSGVGPVVENKELITWARFEFGDINDPALYPDTSDDRNSTAPLLLVLGYGNGVQVWAIPASGEATEVLSWRQGVVRTLRVLPTPPPSPSTLQPDTFAHKRPLVALCDSTAPGAQFCSLSFISLRGGDQVKSIKFKNSVNDVLANRTSVVVSFHERIAVFDASTLEDRMTITTCYPCPGPNPNPVALGSRWMAYAERRLIPSKRCSGGTEGEGIQSYTATVLHAAKSLGKGLRELGETVASSLTGSVTPPGSRIAGSNAVGQSDAEVLNPGVVTVVDVQGTWKENGRMEDNVIAHFTANSEAIVALKFDPSGMLLVTADKRGHDFHLFRIQPHPGGSPLAAVHHLYVLHRGDTTAKVQDIAFASDSRWVAVSTLRGTTHVFPVTPYGGAVGLRTHSTPHVVNRLSRFHRSAGLTADGRNSPQPNTQQQQQQASENQSTAQAVPYPNPRLPPYPHPTVVMPLAQIRQPVMHLAAPNSPNPSNQAAAYHRNPSVKVLGRNQSSSEDSAGIPLRVSACFAPSRAWLVGSPTMARESCTRASKKAVDSLFVMACHGNLIEYDLETKHATGIPKEKICDDTPIELEVVAKAQWLLLRPPHSSQVQPPLPNSNPLMVIPCRPPGARDTSTSCLNEPGTVNSDERWLSHVEIVTHAGPHRRLWMGPQFTFKTYTTSASVGSSLVESESVDIGCDSRLARSNPVNMPLSNAARHSGIVPFLIESGSGGSLEQSPHLLEVYGATRDGNAGPGETQLREELADAMMESPGMPTRDGGRRVIVELQEGKTSQAGIPIEKIVNPVGTVLTVITDEASGDGRVLDGEPMDMTVRWPTDVKQTSKINQVLVTTKKGSRAECEVLSAETEVEGRSSKKRVKPAAAPVAADIIPDDIQVTSLKKGGKSSAPVAQVIPDNKEESSRKKRGKSIPLVNEVIVDEKEVSSLKKRGKSIPLVNEVIPDLTEESRLKKRDKASAQSLDLIPGDNDGSVTKLVATKGGNEIVSKRREQARRATTKESLERKQEIASDNPIQGASDSLTWKGKMLPVSGGPSSEVEITSSSDYNDAELILSESTSYGIPSVKSRDRSTAKDTDATYRSSPEKNQECLLERKEKRAPEAGVSEKKRQNRLTKLVKPSRSIGSDITEAQSLPVDLPKPSEYVSSDRSVHEQESLVHTSTETSAEQFVRPTDVSLSNSCVDQEDSFESVAESFADCVVIDSETLANCFVEVPEKVRTVAQDNVTGSVWMKEVLEQEVALSEAESNAGTGDESVTRLRVANENVAGPEKVSAKTSNKLAGSKKSFDSGSPPKWESRRSIPSQDVDACDGLQTDAVAAEPVDRKQLPETKVRSKTKPIQATDERKAKANSPTKTVLSRSDASPEGRGSSSSELETSKWESTKTTTGRKAKRNEAKLLTSGAVPETSGSIDAIDVDADNSSKCVDVTQPTRKNRVHENSLRNVSVSNVIFKSFDKATDEVDDCDGIDKTSATTDTYSHIDTDVTSPQCLSMKSSDLACKEDKKRAPSVGGGKSRASPKKSSLESKHDFVSKPTSKNETSLQTSMNTEDEKFSLPSVDNVRLSPPKLWSSIASGKCERQESRKCDVGGSAPLKYESPDHSDTTLLPETVYNTPLDFNTSQIDNGAPQIDNGAPQMDNGAPQVANGAPQIANGAPQIDNGAPQIDNESPQIDNGPPQMDNGPPQIDNGAPQIDSGCGNLVDGSISCSERLVEVESCLNNEEDANNDTSAQAIKKNRKKNKKRR